MNAREEIEPVDSRGSEYEVYALSYASRPGQKSREYYGYALYGDEDGPAGLDYFFWVARNRDRTVLIDCGYDKEVAAREGRYLKNDPNNDPIEVLALLGITPEDVDHIVITHMHHDHVGNLHRFPRASFSISRQEYDFVMGPLAGKELFTKIFDAPAAGFLSKLAGTERLLLVDEPTTVLPGIEFQRVGGHSPGQSIVKIATASGTVVLASDLIHFYEELATDRPFWVFTDLEESYRGYQLLRDLEAQPRTTIVAGHDPEVMRRFAPAKVGPIVDLTSPNVIESSGAEGTDQ